MHSCWQLLFCSLHLCGSDPDHPSATADKSADFAAAAWTAKLLPWHNIFACHIATEGIQTNSLGCKRLPVCCGTAPNRTYTPCSKAHVFVVSFCCARYEDREKTLKIISSSEDSESIGTATDYFPFSQGNCVTRRFLHLSLSAVTALDLLRGYLKGEHVVFYYSLSTGLGSESPLAAIDSDPQKKLAIILLISSSTEQMNSIQCG